MLGPWLLELGKGIGTLFIHPLFYWMIVLYFIIGYKRIKRERTDFGMKLNDYFAEGSGTFVWTLFFSLLISTFTLLFGFVMSFEVIIVLAIVLFLLSIFAAPSFLSAGYSIAITFLLLFIAPYIIQIGDAQLLSFVQVITPYQFTTLALLAGLFIIVEALYLSSINKRPSFPYLTKSNRGLWIGKHELSRLAFIPFFVLVPTNTNTGFLPLFPTFELGNEFFSLFLVPFFIGYRYSVQSMLPVRASKRLSNANLMLGLLVLFIAIGSLYINELSLLAVLVALIGKEWITYRFRSKDEKERALFTRINEGIKVVATIPQGPADRLGILTGETIVKVNDVPVNNSNQFYEALQNSGAFVKLDVLDNNGEIRFIRSAFYEEDHHELGVLFIEQPFAKAKDAQ